MAHHPVLIAVILSFLATVLAYNPSRHPLLLSTKKKNGHNLFALAPLDDRDRTRERMNGLSSADMISGPIIDLLYDSECPVCQMEVSFLMKRDVHGRIRFTDLTSPEYNPAEHGNVQFKDGMRKIRAVLPDNTVVTGVEVFRRTYDAIGLGWVFAATNLPIIGDIADFVYDIWAEHRLRLTGRNDLADQLARTAEELRNAEPIDCEETCDLDFDDDEDEIQDDL